MPSTAYNSSVRTIRNLALRASKLAYASGLPTIPVMAELLL